LKILVIVNESPWGSSLGVTALRLTRAIADRGEHISAVFFREDGVYHALPGRAVDHGTPGLVEAWQMLAGQGGFPLLLCSSASQRRFQQAPEGSFREAGLAEMMELMTHSDRVVTF
jgi:sulfur relay protein TusD/DsrE